MASSDLSSADTGVQRAPAPPIDGHCDTRFARLREAFASNFIERDELGAALCVVIDGVRVVDLWGGHRDLDKRQPWLRDTLVNAYSVGKGILSVLVLSAVERGLIDLDAPVSRWWPEFAAGGKADLRVRTLLCHRAGLPAIREPMPEDALFDWSMLTGALARQDPYWEPDSDHGYHVNTYGILVGELVSRATRLPVASALREFVTGPIDADFYFGVPKSDLGRAASILLPQIRIDSPEKWAMAFPPTGDAEHDHMIWHAYFNPTGFSGLENVNTEPWRRAVHPSTNGHGTARAVAAIYSALIGSGPRPKNWPGKGLLAEATSVHSDGPDRMLGRPSRFGIGFQLSQQSRPLGVEGRAFGHYGYGGSLGFADPDAKLGLAYLINRPGKRWQTPRTETILSALYDCV